MNKIDCLANQIENFDPLPFDAHGWNGVSPVFGDMVAKIPFASTIIVEIGSWKGQSTLSILDACRSNGKIPTVFCIDTWLGANEFWYGLNETPERDLKLKNGYPQIYYQFISNIIRKCYEDWVYPMPMTSLQGIRHLQRSGIKADLIYIDASHEYADVKADITEALTILKPGGIMFGDDFFDWPGVGQAVRETLPGFITLYNNFWAYGNL